MVTALARMLIKDYGDTKDPQVRKAYGMLCGAVGILLNILLFAGKALAGFFSGSIAIVADAFNNLSDAGSSVITWWDFAWRGRSRTVIIPLATAESSTYPAFWFPL